MEPKDIDFVLVSEIFKIGQRSGAFESSNEKRRIFEENLREEGLILESEDLKDTNLKCTKIHAPLSVLRPYAEILKLRMPMRHIPQLEALKSTTGTSTSTGICRKTSVINSTLQKFNKYFELDPRKFPERNAETFYATYSRDREYLFDIDDSTHFFSSGVRSQIVDYILKRKRYSNEPEDEFAFGIERLLKENVYCGAYPLHSGDLGTPGTMRHLLGTEWASLLKAMKHQPLEEIKEYLGVKVGLYFVWLGFYTKMLVPASLLGLICFIYGLATVHTNQHTEDICNSQFKEPMCPLCNKFCSYWKLSDTCFYARLTYLFDNDATLVFSVLMSFWTVIFLEFWKRTAAEIKHRWDLSGFDVNEENPRPAYLSRLKHVEKKKLNLITNVSEPSLSFWKQKFPNTLFSLSMVLLLITLAVSAVVAVILYRISLMVVFLSEWAPKDAGGHGHGWGPIVVNATAVVLNLVFICFFNWLYSFLAVYLTEIELPRTQTEFDDSLTLKIYLLQFINFYSSIFYIAFFKGRLAGSPYKYNYFFGYRHEECGTSGCMSELCIQGRQKDFRTHDWQNLWIFSIYSSLKI
jgi:anoctamin-1